MLLKLLNYTVKNYKYFTTHMNCKKMEVVENFINIIYNHFLKLF